MKNRTISLFFFLLVVSGGLSGCINLNAGETTPVYTPVPSTPASSPPVPADMVLPGTTTIPVPVVNYTAIPFIGRDDPEHPMDETRKNSVARIAVTDDRVRDLLAGGGVVEGVLYQCHPTPKDYSGDACAPALRVFQNGTAWDFLVDEKSRAVIFVQHESPGGAGSAGNVLKSGDPGLA